MNRQPPAPTPFQLFFIQPTASVSTSRPYYIDQIEFLALGERVTAQVPDAGGEHLYTYTIPGGTKAEFRFKHSGHFDLTPDYGAAVVDSTGTGEGSARAHGESATAANPGTVWETLVKHPIGAQRTVTWHIRYIDFGDQNTPYTIEIDLVN